MIIYFALLIPIITVLFLYIYYKREIVWWEFFINIVATFLLVLCSKLIIESIQVHSIEYHGSIITKIEYYEDWNEYISQTCTRTVSCGKNCTTTETYDCSYVSYHSAEYIVYTSTGESFHISRNQYVYIEGKFQNNAFVDMRRDFYSDDGDMYYSVWDGSESKIEPVTIEKSYENRIKVADQSLFHYKEVTKEDIKKYNLKNYPEVNGYYQNCILGDNSPDAKVADNKFQNLNAVLGAKKQVKVFILVFEGDLDASYYQEYYWSGGNKNEFIVCIGIDKSRKVNWCRVISWCKSEDLKVDVKNYIEKQETLNLTTLYPYMFKEIDKKYVRRDFKEFEYLTVEPPLWSIIVVFILTILMNIGISIWIIQNEFSD